MKAKTVDESRVTISAIVTPQDANISGNVHGGVIMKHIDNVGGIVATRHSQCSVVTASIERIDFHRPAFIGDILTLKASLNMVGRTSMEVGVRVESENVMTGEIRHNASAYLTFVAMDEDRNVKEVPPLKLESEDDNRRYQAALQRKQRRTGQD